jgi:L-iditol 2-dehydrogenase
LIDSNDRLTASGLGLVKHLQGAGHVSLQDVKVGPPGDGQALLQIAAAGICGTDLHILDGEWPVRPPVLIGHELSGTVLAVGPGVSEEWIGARVVSEVFYGSDGTCDACRDGHRNLCPNRQSLGSHVNGAFAPAVIVPVSNLHIVPSSIDLVDAALLEPLACAVGALCDPPVINPGDRVLVTGPGAIGLFAAQIARAAGGDVVVSGRDADQGRLEVAVQLGLATHVSTGDLSISLEEQFDVVIECAGAAAAAAACLAAVKRRGKYVQLGLFGGPVPIDMNTVCLKDLTVTSGFGATPQGFRRAIRLAAAQHVRLGPLVTRVAPLSEWENVFAAARRGEGVKFLFAPSR